MVAHTLKYLVNENDRTKDLTYWCGRKVQYVDSFYFSDAQHLALAVGGSVQPCKNCIKAIVYELKEK